MKKNAKTLGEVALPFGVEDAAPCFIGHYWLDGEPSPLAPNIACLDYSIAKAGKLVAYRWQREQILGESGFTHKGAAI